MTKTAFFTASFIIIILCSFSNAEEPFAPQMEASGSKRMGHVIPDGGEQNQRAVETEIDKKIDLENQATQFNHDVRDDENSEDGSAAIDGIQSVTRDESGRIEGEVLDDGTVVTYEYKDGELTLDTKDVSLVFRDETSSVKMNGEDLALASTSSSMSHEKAHNPDETEKSRNIVVEVYLKDSPENITPALKFTCPDASVSVDRLAMKPMKFDFKEIKKAIEDTSKMRGGLLKEYRKNTDPYYVSIDTAIRERIGELAKDGVDLNGFGGDVPDDARRDVIDRAVRDIYIQARKYGSGKAIMDFISMEKDLRNRIVNPGTEIYDRGMEEALEYTNAMMEKLVKSQLVLYLNVRKDKIDVIINLKKPSRPNK